MRAHPTRILALLLGGLAVTGPTTAPGQEKLSSTRKVLVELYTSQGCNSCPPASDLMGKFPALGFGPNRVIPLNFHVDYFNTPWEDPYSEPSYSDREQSYNHVMKRTDLYFTPMMMVDGRYPFLGSNRDQAVAAIRKAKTTAPGVNLDLDLDGLGARRTVTVKLAARTAEVAGRDLLVVVALTQDQVTTRVPSGENAGKTLVEHHVVRRLDHKFTKLDRTEAKTLTFTLTLPAGADPASVQVVAFAQDRANGQVHQAESVPWAPLPRPPPHPPFPPIPPPRPPPGSRLPD